MIGEHDEKTQSPSMGEEIEELRKPEEPVAEAEEPPSVEQDVISPDVSGQQAVPSLSVSPQIIEEKKSKPGVRVLFTLILISISLVAGISIVGLHQSTENVGSSRIVVQPVPPPLPAPQNPTTEPTVVIEVYGDSGCTEVMTVVEWGPIEKGSSVSQVVYVKNAGDASVTLSLMTDNWDFDGAANHMTLSWNCDGNPIDSGDIVEIVLMLSIDSSGTFLGEFTFDIVFLQARQLVT